MTVQAKQISVSGTVSTALASAAAGDVNGMNFTLTNRGPGTAFVGAQNVVGTTGYQLGPADTTTGHLTAGEAIYGIVASGTAVVHALSTSL